MVPQCFHGCRVEKRARLIHSAGSSTKILSRWITEVKGKCHEVKDDLKERAARVAGNPEQETEGRDEKLAGKVQKYLLFSWGPPSAAAAVILSIRATCTAQRPIHLLLQHLVNLADLLWSFPPAWVSAAEQV